MTKSESIYTSVPGFRHVYLEDSFVLGINAEPGRVVFDIELVLIESHPAYAPPKRGEQHCYRRGLIRFENVESLSWTGQMVVKPAVDASGEQDFGGIDDLRIAEGVYALEGDFGRLEIASSPPALDLLP
jgi:hypothetical protein